MDERPENLRTEYSALTSYYGTVITFRFTTVAFFLAAVGLIVQAGLTRSTSILLVLLTLGTWIVELRNRSVFRALLDRATQIEEDWQFQGRDSFSPLFRRMIRAELWQRERKATGKEPCPPFPSDEFQFLFWRVRLPNALISHSLGLDLIYGGVLLFAIEKAWKRMM